MAISTVCVSVPSSLHDLSRNSDKLHVVAGNIQELIINLDNCWPIPFPYKVMGWRNRIYDDKKGFDLSLNGKKILLPEGGTTPLNAGDQVTISTV